MYNRGAAILVKVLFLIYIGMVLFFCFFNLSMPDLELPGYFLGIRIDRYFHFIMFLPYPFIGWLTYRYSRHLGRYKEFASSLTLVTGMVFAVATELVQKYLLISRDGDIKDFFADLCGLLVGTIVVRFIGEWMIRITEKIVPPKEHDDRK